MKTGDMKILIESEEKIQEELKVIVGMATAGLTFFPEITEGHRESFHAINKIAHEIKDTEGLPDKVIKSANKVIQETEKHI